MAHEWFMLLGHRFARPLRMEPFTVNLSGEKRPGVYFLVDGNEIVYVGLSADCDSRVCYHKCNPRGQWQSAYWFSCCPEDAKVIEAAWIECLQPRDNSMNTGGTKKMHHVVSMARYEQAYENIPHAMPCKWFAAIAAGEGVVRWISPRSSAIAHDIGQHRYKKIVASRVS